MSHSQEQKRQKAEAMRVAEHHAKNSTVDGDSKKSSYWDMPGYNENDERAKIDAKWKAGHASRMADNEKYGTNYKD